MMMIQRILFNKLIFSNHNTGPMTIRNKLIEFNKITLSTQSLSVLRLKSNYLFFELKILLHKS